MTDPITTGATDIDASSTVVEDPAAIDDSVNDTETVDEEVVETPTVVVPEGWQGQPLESAPVEPNTTSEIPQ